MGSVLRFYLETTLAVRFAESDRSHHGMFLMMELLGLLWSTQHLVSLQFSMCSQALFVHALNSQKPLQISGSCDMRKVNWNT